MTLIERARGWSDTNQHPDDTQLLLNDLAAEVERLLTFEVAAARLKSEDLEGAWFDGYYWAVSHFSPIIGNLSGAIGFMEVEGDHEHS